MAQPDGVSHSVMYVQKTVLAVGSLPVYVPLVRKRIGVKQRTLRFVGLRGTAVADVVIRSLNENGMSFSRFYVQLQRTVKTAAAHVAAQRTAAET